MSQPTPRCLTPLQAGRPRRPLFGLGVLVSLCLVVPGTAAKRYAKPEVSAASRAAFEHDETRSTVRGRELLAGGSGRVSSTDSIQLCQALGPAAPYCIGGVDCLECTDCGECGWESARQIAWQAFAQGEYVGHYRLQHVPVYRLRVDDELEFIYRVTRDVQSTPYRLQVGDQIRIESFADPQLNRPDLIVQPDGTITVRLLNQVKAAGLTVTQITDHLETAYKKFYREPSITVTPLQVNTKLEDLRATVDGRFGSGGQRQQARVTPEGTVQLPAIGSVFVQGLSLEEVRNEVNERYNNVVFGIEVVPQLLARAARFVYVVGAVTVPGRYELVGPTTAMQSISLAGGWLVGANLRQVVVFRRGDDWRLMATMLDLRGALYAKKPCPSDEIWLNDSDIVVVPRSPVLQADDFIDLVFTRGIYGVIPNQGISINFAKLGSL